MHSLLPTPGEVIWIRQRRWRVRRASRCRNVVRIDVAARDEQLTFLSPFDRLARPPGRERRRRIRPQGAKARLADLLARAHGVRTLASAAGARVAILPHQLEPALAVLHGARRVLLADEVGLGKTIQAGLVVAELTRRRSAPRILVVVPAALADQWRAELAERFGLEPVIADRDRLDELGRTGPRDGNPWGAAGVWIASLDFIKQPQVLGALPDQLWDLVVIDEAHGACGDSDRHAAAASIARRARHLLLLTATPHDGDHARFGRLIGLGALARDPIATGPSFPETDDRLTMLRRTRADVAAGPGRRVRWHGVTLSPEETQVLRALGAFERAVVAAAGAARREAALLLLSVFRKRAASTMTALAVTLERRQAWIERAGGAAPDWLQPSLPGLAEDPADDLGPDEPGALAADVGLDPRQERAWLKRLRGLAEAARRRESKIARLASLLCRSREPVAVFTEFRHSLEAVRDRIGAIRPTAVLHGGQTMPERTRELARFLDGSASVLLATDVASLGLNLQHRARWAICLELPWNPARLEQRLGRVDRIGQSRSVHLTLLVARHFVETAVLAQLARRTLAARRAVGDDALGGIAIDAARLGAALIAGAPLDAPSRETPDAPPLCRRWTRVARAAARTLEQRRRLIAHWRTPVPDHGRTRCATWRGRVRPDGGRVFRPGRHGETLLILSVPILDGSGAPIEEHVVAIRISRERSSPAIDDTTIEAARERASRSLLRRLERVRRWLVARHDADEARDRALTAAMARGLAPVEGQPGLFDRRGLQAFDAARRAVSGIRENTADRLADRDRIADASLGRPRLAFIITRS